MKKSDYSPGSILADRYKIVEIIGRGGVGIIVRAVDLILNLDVAVKILAVDHSGLSAARLQREATAAGNLSHPGIARIMDFGQTNEGSPYMVMELLSGINLAQLIQEKSKVSFHTAMPIFYQICDALDHAHKNGIIHRDLKPSNVMLLEQPSGGYLVKLLDFGVAKTQMQGQTLTPTGVIIGSPFYISPEQALGAELDSRSDIYSLGCLMYELLSGKPPFVGNTAFETVSMHRKSPQPVLPDLEGEDKIPNSLIDLVEHCLKKEKEERPQEMKIVMNCLKPLLLEEIDQTEFLARKSKKSNKLNPNRIMALAGMLITLVGTWIYIKSPQPKSNSPKIIIRKGHSTPWESYEVMRDKYKDYKFKEDNAENLKIISIISDTTTDEDFKSLSKKHFDYLRTRPCDVTGTGFAYLKNSGVKILRIKDSKITDEGMKAISQVKTITSIYLQSSKITDKGIAYLKYLPALNYLYLFTPTFSEKSADEIAQIKTLVNFEIFSPQFNDNHLDQIAKLPNLQHLGLRGTDNGSEVGVKLSHIRNLHSLILNDLKQISPESLEALASKQLVNLKMKDSKLSHEHFVALSKMKSLQWLDLGRVDISAEELKLFLVLPDLERLELDGPREISDEFIDVLSKFKLENINLSQTSLKDGQLLRLQNMKTLKVINLSGCDDLSNEAMVDFVTRFKYRWKSDVNVVNNESRDMSEFF